MRYEIRRTNRVLIWIFIILLPPVGLILLWVRKDSRIIAKLFKTLAVGV